MEPVISKEGAEYALSQFAKVWDDDPEKYLNKKKMDNDEVLERELADMNEIPLQMPQLPQMQPMTGASKAPTTNLAGRLSP